MHPQTSQSKRLPPRQTAILRFIERYIKDNGYAPNIREIGKALSINSTSAVNYSLNKLAEAGYLERSERVSRGLRVIQMPGNHKAPRFHATSNALSIEIPLTGDPTKVVAALQALQVQLHTFTEEFASKQTS